MKIIALFTLVLFAVSCSNTRIVGTYNTHIKYQVEDLELLDEVEMTAMLITQSYFNDINIQPHFFKNKTGYVILELFDDGINFPFTWNQIDNVIYITFTENIDGVDNGVYLKPNFSFIKLQYNEKKKKWEYNESLTNNIKIVCELERD